MQTTTIRFAGLSKLLWATTLLIASLQPVAFAQTTPATTSGLLTAAQYDDVATLLIGKTPTSGLPSALSQSQKWATYTQTVETNWAEYT
ncbi:MAG: hypothetical protein ACKO0Z_19575, partial [Betaproteobacteria bacterium]